MTRQAKDQVEYQEAEKFIEWLKVKALEAIERGETEIAKQLAIIIGSMVDCFAPLDQSVQIPDWPAEFDGLGIPSPAASQSELEFWREKLLSLIESISKNLDDEVECHAQYVSLRMYLRQAKRYEKPGYDTLHRFAFGSIYDAICFTDIKDPTPDMLDAIKKAIEIAANESIKDEDLREIRSILRQSGMNIVPSQST